jgi:hypothetical protein
MGKNKEIFLGGNSNLNMKSSKLMTTYQGLNLITDKGAYHLNIKIEADFDEIPNEYHEVFFNMMAAKYTDSVSFGDNPFSLCVPQEKPKKWYQFWKSKN